MPRLYAALALSLVLVGCAGTATERRALALYHTAVTLEDATREGREMVLERREEVMRSAGRAARDRGAPDEEVREVILTAAATFDEGPLVDAMNAAIAAKSTFTHAVRESLNTEGVDLATLLPIAIQAVSAYESLRAALGERGQRLPSGPQVLGDLLGGG